MRNCVSMARRQQCCSRPSHPPSFEPLLERSSCRPRRERKFSRRGLYRALPYQRAGHRQPVADELRQSTADGRTGWAGKAVVLLQASLRRTTGPPVNCVARESAPTTRPPHSPACERENVPSLPRTHASMPAPTQRRPPIPAPCRAVQLRSPLRPRNRRLHNVRKGADGGPGRCHALPRFPAPGVAAPRVSVAATHRGQRVAGTPAARLALGAGSHARRRCLPLTRSCSQVCRWLRGRQRRR